METALKVSTSCPICAGACWTCPQKEFKGRRRDKDFQGTIPCSCLARRQWSARPRRPSRSIGSNSPPSAIRSRTVLAGRHWRPLKPFTLASNVRRRRPAGPVTRFAGTQGRHILVEAGFLQGLWQVCLPPRPQGQVQSGLEGLRQVTGVRSGTRPVSWPCTIPTRAHHIADDAGRPASHGLHSPPASRRAEGRTMTSAAR